MGSKQEKVWKCSTCSKTFPTKQRLTNHIVTHDPEAKVKCQVTIWICNAETNFTIWTRMTHLIALVMFRFAENSSKILKPYHPTCQGFIVIGNDQVVPFVTGCSVHLPTSGNTLTQSTAGPNGLDLHANFQDVGKPTWTRKMHRNT